MKNMAHTNSVENQSDIDVRIKDTQHLESQVLFEDVAISVESFSGEAIDQFTNELTTTEKMPRDDIYRYDMMLGDASLDAQVNFAPAWKVVALQNMITSSSPVESGSGARVPQLNIVANYRKKIEEATVQYDPENVRVLDSATRPFIDGKMIVLKRDDPIYYVEELNTQLLMENFEIEVFQLMNSSSATVVPDLEKKIFPPAYTTN